MGRYQSFGIVILAVAVITAFPILAAEARSVDYPGNAPVRNTRLPVGSEAVANLPSRVGYTISGLSDYIFYYRCDGSAEFQETLDEFARVCAPELELVIHSGSSPWSLRWRTGGDIRVDWTFRVSEPAAYRRLAAVRGLPWPPAGLAVTPPRINLYLDDGNPISWGEIDVPETIRVVDERLGPGVEDGTHCWGLVFDMATWQPIPGAEIRFNKIGEDGRAHKGTTIEADESGRFDIRDLADGRYIIEARAEGYASLEGEVHSTQRPAREYRIQLAREAAARGSVRNAEGEPIEGAIVHAWMTVGVDGRAYSCPGGVPSATTDADGGFEIDGLPTGYTILSCRAEGFHLPEQSVVHRVPVEDLVLTLVRTGVIRGKTVATDSAADGGPRSESLRLCPVRQTGHFDQTNVSSEGTFEFEEVPAGEYRIGMNPFLSSDADDPFAKAVTVEPGASVEVEIEDPGADYYWERNREIRHRGHRTPWY